MREYENHAVGKLRLSSALNFRTEFSFMMIYGHITMNLKKNCTLHHVKHWKLQLE